MRRPATKLSVGPKLVAGGQALGAISILASNSPEAVKHPFVIDLIDDEARLVLDRVCRRENVVHAHAEPSISRAGDVPTNAEGFLEMTSTVTVPEYWEPSELVPETS